MILYTCKIPGYWILLIGLKERKGQIQFYHIFNYFLLKITLDWVSGIISSVLTVTNTISVRIHKFCYSRGTKCVMICRKGRTEIIWDSFNKSLWLSHGLQIWSGRFYKNFRFSYKKGCDVWGLCLKLSYWTLYHLGILHELRNYTFNVNFELFSGVRSQDCSKPCYDWTQVEEINILCEDCRW